MLQLSQVELGLLENEELVMAFYIKLMKLDEDEQGVTYQFGNGSENLGKIYLNKANGNLKELELEKHENYHHYLVRAEVKLHQHWKAGNFPYESCWAS